MWHRIINMPIFSTMIYVNSAIISKKLLYLNTLLIDTDQARTKILIQNV